MKMATFTKLLDENKISLIITSNPFIFDNFIKNDLPKISELNIYNPIIIIDASHRIHPSLFSNYEEGVLDKIVIYKPFSLEGVLNIFSKIFHKRKFNKNNKKNMLIISSLPFIFIPHKFWIYTNFDPLYIYYGLKDIAMRARYIRILIFISTPLDSIKKFKIEKLLNNVFEKIIYL